MLRKPFRPAAALFVATAALLGACTDDSSAPALGTTVATRSLADAGGAAPARWLVVFNAASGAPKSFAAEVAALGGTIEPSLEGVGAAVVTGIGEDGAARLRAQGGVLAVDADLQVARRIARAEPQEQALMADAAGEVAASEPQSATAPYTAILYGAQWNLRAVEAEAAWRAGILGSSAVTVAILDSGIDPLGVDLSGRVDLARSKSFVAVDDSIVRAVFPTRHITTDLDGHGTNVASQVASNGIAFAGVTSRTRLMSVKVCSVKNFCSIISVLQGVIYAVDNGADVINMSLGGGFLKPDCNGCVATFQRVLNYAHRAGVTVVVSAGNDQRDLDHDGPWYDTYCSVPNVICVAATGPLSDGSGSLGPFSEPDAPAAYSNFGRSAISVAAPGGNYSTALGAGGQPVIAGQSWVWSLCSKTQLAYNETTGALTLTSCSRFPNSVFTSGYRGTSQAAPHVAALAALLVERYGRSPAQIRAAIQQSADDLGEPGTDARYGKGRINVARALGLL